MYLETPFPVLHFLKWRWASSPRTPAWSHLLSCPTWYKALPDLLVRASHRALGLQGSTPNPFWLLLPRQHSPLREHGLPDAFLDVQHHNCGEIQTFQLGACISVPFLRSLRPVSEAQRYALLCRAPIPLLKNLFHSLLSKHLLVLVQGPFGKSRTAMEVPNDSGFSYISSDSFFLG